MIKNQKQVKITEERLEELIKARAELQSQINQIDKGVYKFSLNSISLLIEDLEKQLIEYKSLTEGNFHCLHPRDLDDLPRVLIAARLAQKMSQKELANKVNLKEQQIQRYEATDYETVSWPRLVNIAIALKLKFYFEKIIIINSEEETFEYPNGITNEQVESVTEKVKKNHSLIL